MCHPLKNILLDPLVSGETWGGLTWTITSGDVLLAYNNAGSILKVQLT